MKSFLKRLFYRKEASQGLRKYFEICQDGNIGAKNILIFTEHVNATYFISFDLPLRELHVQGGVNFAVASQKQVESCGSDVWKEMLSEFSADLVIMTRYGLPYGPEIQAFFKDRKIPVIYHIDDDLLDLPSSLGSEIQKRQGAENVIQARSQLIQGADLVYVSTKFLCSVLQAKFPEQRYFYGMYAPYLGDQLSSIEKVGGDQQTFGYMGSKGHKEDLELVVPDIIRLLDERPDLNFEVFGTIHLPEELKRFGRRVSRRTVQKSYKEFLETLSSLNWAVGLAPLVNEPFNRCKAPTKFIEYTACNIPVVASNISVYSEVIPENGGYLVESDWHTAISSFLDSPKERRNALISAQTFCRRSFAPAMLEMQLKQIFSMLNV